MGKIKQAYPCALQLTFDVIGGKWKLIILWHLIEQPKRFSQIRELLPQLTQKILTEQLRELEEREIIVRSVYQEVPPHVEYGLSEIGKTLIPLIHSLCEWTNEYADMKNIVIAEDEF